MTTAADGPSRGYNLTMWLAHHEPHILVAVVIASAVDRILHGATPNVWTITSVISIGMLILMLLAFSATWTHNNALCWRCARATPLDGPAAAAQHDHTLRVWHWQHDKRGLAVMLALLGLSLAGPFFAPALPWSAPLFVLFAIDSAAGLRHRPLEPWCPYCRRRRHWEDDGVPEPSPTPDPSGARERV